MVFSTRVRRNDDAIKYFCLDNKKKYGCIEGPCLITQADRDARMIHISPLPGQKFFGTFLSLVQYNYLFGYDLKRWVAVELKAIIKKETTITIIREDKTIPMMAQVLPALDVP